MSGWNPWKMTAIGMVLVTATALVTGLVVANWNTADKPLGAQPMDRRWPRRLPHPPRQRR